MKKPILLFVFQFIYCAITWSQAPIPFGEVSEADLKMIVYNADSNATAVVLHDYEKIVVKRSIFMYTVKKFRHIQIKILKPSAFDLASISIPFSLEYMHLINGLRAQTINYENGDTVKTLVPEEDYFDENVREGLYIRKFTFPNLKVGSIIEYEYNTETFQSFSISHVFQQGIPVRKSEVVVIIPNHLEYKFDFNQTELPFEHKSKAELKEGDTKTGMIYYFSMKNLPGLEDEPYTDNMENYRAVVWMFQDSNTQNWEEMTRQYLHVNKDFFGRNKYYKRAIRDNKKLIKSTLTLKEKMVGLYENISKSMKWNGYYESSPSQKNLSKKYKTGEGTSADINLILLKLLKEAGIKAYPVLLVTREQGRVNPSLPIMHQFNHVIVKAIVDNKTYFLDAIDGERPYNLLDYQALVPIGWELSEPEGKWIDISYHDSKNIIMPTFELDKEGTITGKVDFVLDGFEGYLTRKEIKENQEKSNDYFQKTYEELLDGAEIGKVNVINLEDKNKRLKFSFEIENGDFADVAGDLIYFNPVWMTEFKANPFVEEKRLTAVNFAYNLEEHYILKLKIPQGYAVESLPKSTKISLPEKSGWYSFLVQEGINKEITVISRLKINQPDFSAEFYPYLKQFFDMVAEKQNEQIVLKKAP